MNGMKNIFWFFLVALCLSQPLQSENIFKAAQEGDLEKIRQLVEQNRQVLFSVDSNKKTALHFAAQQGHVGVVAFLLEKGAEVDARNINGTTPLLYASFGGKTEVIRLLIKQGADLKATERVSGYNALIIAIRGKHTDAARLLLRAGVDINHRSREGETALGWATDTGNREMCNLLLDNGAEVESQVGRWQLIHSAAARGMARVLETLIEKGADVNRKDPYGSTPFQKAWEAGQKEMVELLLKYGAQKAVKKPEVFRGTYVDEDEPGLKPEIFAPGFVSTAEGNERDITFSPDGTELYFSRDAKIHGIRKKEGIWSTPEIASFSEESLNFEACFTPDGKQIFFISRRPESGPWEIWIVNRKGDDWGEPRLLGAPFQGSFYPTFTKDWVMYYTDGDNDLSRSRYIEGRFSTPEKLDKNVNTPESEYNSFIAPDESFIIFNSSGRGEGLGNGDLFISFRNADGSWTVARNMGPGINSAAMDYCPSLSSDGRFFFFSSRREGNEDIYWVSAEIIKKMSPGK